MNGAGFINSELITSGERMSRHHTTSAVAWLLMDRFIVRIQDKKLSIFIGNVHSGKEKRVSPCTTAGKAGVGKMAVTVKEISIIKEKLGTIGKVQ